MSFTIIYFVFKAIALINEDESSRIYLIVRIIA